MFLNRILDFIEGDYLLCPRCLVRLTFKEAPISDVTCTSCGFDIPLIYLQESGQDPPVFLQLFGLTSSGKTTFLDMLRLYLYDMDQVWSGFYHQALTQLDVEHKRMLIQERKRGAIPGSTVKRERNQNEAYMMSLKNMPCWGSRQLVLMDHAGEQFENLSIDPKEIPFLEKTPVTILLFNLPDFVGTGKKVDDLVNSYTFSLKRNRVRLAREDRQLILVFNKADLVPDLPRELQDYLNADTLYSALDQPGQSSPMTEADIEKYLCTMWEMHALIEEWVERDVPGGNNMVNILKGEGVSYRFTVMSATGHQLMPQTPGGQTTPAYPVINPTGPNVGGQAAWMYPTQPQPLLPRPKRVLDPFFWVLEYYKDRGHHDIVPTSLQTLRDTFSPVLHSRWILALLGLLLVGMTGQTIALARLSANPAIATIFSLALILLFVYELVKQRLTKASSPARNMLRLSQLLILGALLAIQTLPSVQQVLANLMLYQVLAEILIGAALFTCFQPEEYRATYGRVALVLLAGMGALLQAFYGLNTILPAFNLLLSPGQMLGPDIIAIGTLVICALLSLWNWGKTFFWFDQVILGIVAIYYGLLQLALGTGELEHLFNFLPPNALFLNFLLIILCVLVIPFCQIFLRRRERLKRLPLLFLSLVGAGMFSYLGPGITTPIGDATQAIYPIALTSTIADVLSPERLITYGLLAGSIVIIFRFLRCSKPFTFLDHALLFLTALVCTQIQRFNWDVPASLAQNIPFIGSLSSAYLLLTLLIVEGVSASLFLLFPLTNQFSLLKKLRQRFFTPERQEQGSTILQTLGRVIERLLASVLSLACTFQILLYGQIVAVGVQLIPYLGPVPRQDTIVEASLCFVTAIIHLILIKRPFTRFSRLLLFVPLISCALLYIQISQTGFQIPLAFVLNNWDQASMYSPGIPFKFFTLFLLLLPLISLWWGTRGRFAGDRRLLQLIFGLGTISGLFLGFTQTPFLAILTILTLVAGMVVATLTLPDNV